MKRFERDFDVAHIIVSKKDWQDIVLSSADHGGGSRKIRIASGLKNVDWDTFNLNDFLFTHCTIVASVCSDKDDHTITEGSKDTINANNNAWLNGVLGPVTNIYRSFRGAENYYEHVQVPYLSKGKILDTVLRKVKNGAGEDVWYADILVATSRNHRDLVARIEKGNLTTLSMGCIANVTQCSNCGKKIHNDSETCYHLSREAGQPYKTKYGYYSRTAELCGVVGDYDSCKFIEASWVESPAFKGAVINHYITGSNAIITAIAEASNIIRLGSYNIDLNHVKEQDIDSLRHLRVADRRGMASVRLLTEALENKFHQEKLNRIVVSLVKEKN